MTTAQTDPEDRQVIPPILPGEVGDCRVAARSDVGRVRAENQDFMGWFHRGERQLLVVADGMGGHRGGYEASRVAVTTVEQAFASGDDLSPAELMTQAVKAADDAIRAETTKRPELTGMGTTLVLALIEGHQMTIGHVGDSRAYRVRAGVAEQLTQDHTQVRRMVEAGLLTEEQAENHPLGHVLDRCLGGKEVPPIALTEPEEFAPGDALILCSDGFSNLVKTSEIGDLFAHADLDQAVQRGIGLALLRGGHDNTTVAAIRRAERPTFQPPAGVPWEHLAAWAIGLAVGTALAHWILDLGG